MTERNPECLACGLPGQWIIRNNGHRLFACSEACAVWIDENYPKPLDDKRERANT